MAEQKKEYGAFNSDKRHTADVRNLEAEARREWTDPARYKGDVDLSRKHLDVVYVDTPEVGGRRQTVLQAVRSYAREHGLQGSRALGPKGTPVITTIFRASADFFERTTPEEQDAYWKACVDWEERHHGHVVFAVLHNDEGTPHLHVFTMPVVERQRQRRVYVRDDAGNKVQDGFDRNGRPKWLRKREPVFDDDGTPAMETVISASDVLGNRLMLSDAQTSFYEEVSGRFGLERGERRVSKAEDKKERDQLADQVANLRQEVSDLEGERDELQTTIRTRGKKADDLKKHCDDLEAKGDDLARENAEAEARVQLFQEHKRRIDDICAKAEQAEREDERRRKRLEDLDRRTADMLAYLDGDNAQAVARASVDAVCSVLDDDADAYEQAGNQDAAEALRTATLHVRDELREEPDSLLVRVATAIRDKVRDLVERVKEARRQYTPVYKDMKNHMREPGSYPAPQVMSPEQLREMCQTGSLASLTRLLADAPESPSEAAGGPDGPDMA